MVYWSVRNFAVVPRWDGSYATSEVEPLCYAGDWNADSDGRWAPKVYCRVSVLALNKSRAGEASHSHPAGVGGELLAPVLWDIAM